ncbi:MAG: CoA transferase [Chloroflexota bacterium]|nr:CoA transferase [Chloroflexota bacterium]
MEDHPERSSRGYVSWSEALVTVSDNLNTNGSISRYRIVELCDTHGVLGGRILAGLGAEVIKVEPPADGSIRPEIFSDEGLMDRNVASRRYQMDAGKKSVSLDLTESKDLDRFVSLLESSDVLLESAQKSYIGSLGFTWPEIHEKFPNLIYTTISPFGRTGPKSSWLGEDLVTMAAGGLMYLCGDPDRAPLRVSVPQASAQASIQAVVGTLIALRARKNGAPSQHVDVSMQEAIVNTLGNSQATYAMTGAVSKRSGGGRASGEGGMRLVWPCKDGYVAFSRSQRSLPLIDTWMKEAGFAADLSVSSNGQEVTGILNMPDISSPAASPEAIALIDEQIEEFFRNFNKMELYEEGQRRGTMMCPVSDVSNLFENAQLQQRQFFTEIYHEELGKTLTYPGPPFKMSRSAWRSEPVAPKVGEHTEEIFSSDRPIRKPDLPTVASDNFSSRDILKGLKVVDFSWVGVGPMAAQTLAFFGAEVIRVESAQRPETFRMAGPLAEGKGPNRSGYWANLNRDKLAITLDLRAEGAGRVVERLIQRADIATESFRPGVMASLGFDYESLRQINSELVMISMSMEGQGGPHAGFKGFGLTLQATAGITGLTGWPDRPPVGTGVAYTDWFATHLAVTSLLTALEEREDSGEGQYIDLSQLESMIWGLDDAIVLYSSTGELLSPQGNRHQYAAPHGVYECIGQDRWCAISIMNDDQWESFLNLDVCPSWVTRLEFATASSRKSHEDELDQLLNEWTRQFDAEVLTQKLQDVGIPAHYVADAQDVFNDSQLTAREHFWSTRHKVIGEMLWDSPAFKLSETPAYPDAPAPLQGEHNEYVYKEILGFTDEEFIDLIVTGVVN